MATQAHSAYCFEILTASFEHRQPRSLRLVEELWDEYIQAADNQDVDSEETTNVEASQARPAAISRLLNPITSLASSSQSSSSSLSTADASSVSTPVTSVSSKSSSTSSFFRGAKEPSFPLFVTWNTLSRSGHKSLRGCIGTFEALPLSNGLRNYALTAAFEDHRFDPVPASILPSLQVCVTLLTNFSEPDNDPLNWTVGEHGIRISFSDKGRRHSATYLPDVAKEQGWTKEEAIISLMRKAGWTGDKASWRKVKSLEIVRYEGKKVDLDYVEWEEWRSWVEDREEKKARR